MSDVFTPVNQSQEGGRMSFSEYIKTGTSLPRLKENTPYRTILKEWKLVEPADSNQTPHVRLELQLEDRVIVDNRFEAGFNIFEIQIKSQLGIEDQEIPVQELLNRLKEEEFTVWISYTTVNGRTYTNKNYLPPQQEQETSSEKQDIEF